MRNVVSVVEPFRKRNGMTKREACRRLGINYNYYVRKSTSRASRCNNYMRIANRIRAIEEKIHPRNFSGRRRINLWQELVEGLTKSDAESLSNGQLMTEEDRVSLLHCLLMQILKQLKILAGDDLLFYKTSSSFFPKPKASLFLYSNASKFVHFRLDLFVRSTDNILFRFSSAEGNSSVEVENFSEGVLKGLRVSDICRRIIVRPDGSRKAMLKELLDAELKPDTKIM